jgi:hypothetical protein
MRIGYGRVSTRDQLWLLPVNDGVLSMLSGGFRSADLPAGAALADVP